MLESVKGISTVRKHEFYAAMAKPGGGKTFFAGSFPKPILFVEIDSAAGVEPLKNYTDEEIKHINIQSKPGVSILMQLLQLIKELNTEKHEYKTLVIDPYTTVQEDLRAKMSADKGGKSLSFDEHSDILDAMLVLRNRLDELSTKMTILVNLHVKQNENSDRIDGETDLELIPKLTFNNGKILLEKCDVVVYLTKKLIKVSDTENRVGFVGYVGAHPHIDTKIRSKQRMAVNGQWVENLTYDKIKKILEGATEKDAGVKETKINPFTE